MISANLHLLFLSAAILQFCLILILLRNRAKYKRTRALLKEHKYQLENKVTERTESLNKINRQLHDEISQHKTTSDMLRDSREYINSILNSMPLILIGVTPKGIITHWNTSASRIIGIENKEALGKNVDDIFPQFPVMRRHIRAAIETQQPKVFESLYTGSTTGSMTYLDIHFYPLFSDKLQGAVISVEDVSVKVQLENIMIQKEKMMSLGELAAGTAHEINNPLGAVIQALQNIRRRLSDSLDANHQQAEALGTELGIINTYLKERQISSFLDDIEEASTRASKIVSNMLEFAHSTQEHELLDIEELIEHSVHLLTTDTVTVNDLSFADVNMVYELQQPLPKIKGSRIELQQVLINILRNAFQASASWDNCPDAITITMTVIVQPDFIRLSIKDNGPGIDKARQQRIFEPFFTTKEVGMGTGLGLSVSYFIIAKHHQGTLEVESTPGQGSTFIIKLPFND